MKGKVLLIGWSAATWEFLHPLMEAGRLPTLSRLVESGVSGVCTGAPLDDDTANWTTLATGRRPRGHGHFAPTVTSSDALTRRTGSATRTCHALWNIVHRAGGRSLVCNWPSTHPAEPVAGLAVSELYARLPTLPPGVIHPPQHEAALRELRVGMNDLTAPLLAELVPRLAEVDQDHDPRLAVLAGHLARLYNEHLAITYGMEQVGWDFAAVGYHGIDAFAEFARYSPGFRGPALEGDRQLYGGVWEALWRTCDLLLARLMELAGEEATVLLVTPRGLPPLEGCRPAFRGRGEEAAGAWNQRHGIVVMKGPRLRGDALLHGARLEDFAPTVLALLGLPVGRDLEGRVLEEAFCERPEPVWLPSWENEAGDFGRRGETGAIALPRGTPEAIRERFRSRELWLQAQALLEEHDLAEAVPILDELHEREPECDAYACALARGLIELELFAEAEEVVALLETCSGQPVAILLRAHLELKKQRKTACAAALDRLDACAGERPVLLGWAGLVSLGLRDTPRAVRFYGKCLALCPEEPTALAGLSYCRSRERNYTEAEALARRSVALTYSNFYGHFCLGVAQAHLERPAAAIASFETARRLHPGFLPAWRYLWHLYRRQMAPGSPARRELEWEAGALKARRRAQAREVRLKMERRRAG
ncbi:MAG TPA: alkaline phosphatase family protein [Chthoniobacteraceae bacterium]|nr:alkaline phosphatase family protein [Chthoniobacteraceae bacterium]